MKKPGYYKHFHPPRRPKKLRASSKFHSLHFHAKWRCKKMINVTIVNNCFNFTCGRSTVQHFSFVLTNQEAKWTFGFCRYAPNSETAIVILSCLPWHELFYKLLNKCAELTQHGGKRFNIPSSALF